MSEIKFGGMSGGSNPYAAALLGPDVMQKQYQIQQNQRMADALMAQSLAPQEAGQMVSGHYVGASPLNGLAQMLKGYAAAKSMREMPSQQAELAAMQGQQLDSMLGMGGQPTQGQANTASLAAGGQGPTNQAAQAATSFASGGQSPLVPQGADPRQVKNMVMWGGPQMLGELLKDNMKSTDSMKMDRYLNIDPAQSRGFEMSKRIKDGYIAPTSLRPGGYMYDGATGKTQQMPHVPDGFTAQQGTDGQWNVIPVNGGVAALGASAAATQGGKGAVTPFTGGLDVNGNPLPITNQTQAATGNMPNPAYNARQQATVTAESNGNPNAVSPKGARGELQVMPNTMANPGFGVTPARDNSPGELNRVGIDYLDAMDKRYGHTALGSIAYNMGPGATDKWLAAGGDYKALPDETKSYLSQVHARTGVNTYNQNKQQPSATVPIYGAKPMGADANAQTGATNLQNGMADKHKTLTVSNQQAQTNNSYLQNISDLAQKAATGKFSDRKDFVNALLSEMGSERATDEKTANDLLGKYSNQIVARLGQGGLGTDAARAIITAANPNAHMTKEAITEASGNLIGANQMIQAKAKLLTPHFNAQNPQEYNSKELAFDQNADPRVWQYMNMTDPVARAAFAKQTMQQDPKFLDRMRSLNELGVFK